MIYICIMSFLACFMSLLFFVRFACSLSCVVFCGVRLVFSILFASFVSFSQRARSLSGSTLLVPRPESSLTVYRLSYISSGQKEQRRLVKKPFQIRGA